MKTTSPTRTAWLQTSAGARSGAFALADWGLLVAVAAMWGSSYLFIAIGLDALRPGVVAAARLLLGIVALAVVPAARRPIEREDLHRVALLGIVWIGLPLILFPLAQRSIDSSIAGMLAGATPLTTAAFAALLLGRLPGTRQVSGVAVGLVGVLAISWPSIQGAQGSTTGAALVLTAIVLYGLAGNLAVPLQQRYGALPVLLRAQIAALALVGPFGISHVPGSSFAWPSALSMIPLGVLSTGYAYVAMTTLVGRVGSTRGSIAIYLVPVVATILGLTIRSEPFFPLTLTGAALVILGAWLGSRPEAPPSD